MTPNISHVRRVPKQPRSFPSVAAIPDRSPDAGVIYLKFRGSVSESDYLEEPGLMAPTMSTPRKPSRTGVRGPCTILLTHGLRLVADK